MDTNNWRPTDPAGEPTMDTGDWRAQLPPDSRQRNVNKVTETLKRKRLPFSRQGRLQELENMTVRFEEEIYTAATSQPDYLRKFSLEMLTMESCISNVMASNNVNNPSGPGVKLHFRIKEQDDYSLMDTNNWRPTAPAGEPTMDTGDWRAQLPPDLRQIIINKVMETLRKHLPFSGQGRLQEPKNMGVRFEEEIYTAATSQPDYLRKISLEMLRMETESQNNILNGMASNNVNNPSDPGGHANGGDWQEEVYQKIKVMKETYYPELNEMYQKIAARLQQHDSLPQQTKSEQLEKLRAFKLMLERVMSFLLVAKSSITPLFKERLGHYEKQIVSFVNTNKPRKTIPSMLPGQVPRPHIHTCAANTVSNSSSTVP